MKILNFGSLNIDYTYRLKHIVQAGETITSQDLSVYPGGKGLNQSIALSRAGANVFHAGSIGADGIFLKDICVENGINTDYIREISTQTGNAIIQVSDEGENCIILYTGANRKNTKEYIEEVLSHFEKDDFLILQNEINMVDYLIERGHQKGMKIVLNPSPFDRSILDCNLSKVDIFMLNEIEGEQCTGETLPENILSAMENQYPHAEIILTLGKNGSLYSGHGKRFSQPAFPAKAIDTTAAGDTFTGYFIASYCEGQPIPSALELAAKASSIAVSRKGATTSIPYRHEIIH